MEDKKINPRWQYPEDWEYLGSFSWKGKDFVFFNRNNSWQVTACVYDLKVSGYPMYIEPMLYGR